MIPKLFFFLIPVFLLIVAALVLFLWERMDGVRGKPEPGNGVSEGAFRPFYHALWILLVWSGFCLTFPLWASYKEKIIRVTGQERVGDAFRVLVFPLIMLALLWYGGRQGYLKWIDGLSWPDKENE